MFNPDPGSDFFSIPDLGSRSGIRIKKCKYIVFYVCMYNVFYPKKLFLSSRKYDSRCSSQIRIPDSDLDFLYIPDPGVKRAPDPETGSATLQEKKIFLRQIPVRETKEIDQQKKLHFSPNPDSGILTTTFLVDP
jgi:hypothetical protein